MPRIPNSIMSQILHPQTLLSKVLLLLPLTNLPLTAATPSLTQQKPTISNRAQNQSCFNISGSLSLSWTAVNFTFNSTQVTPPTDSSGSGSGYIPPVGPNTGQVFFNLTNTAVNYIDSCAGRLDPNTFDSGWLICQDPNSHLGGSNEDDTPKSAFRFNVATGILQINQTWGCKQTKETEEESIWFQAAGSVNITGPCHVYYWANWTTGDASSAIHDCETQNFTVVPDTILEIGGAMLS